jgi:hypothetical protein
VVEQRVAQKKGPQMRGVGALKPGDKILSRTEETAEGMVAFPMKKLPTRPKPSWAWSRLMARARVAGAG